MEATGRNQFLKKHFLLLLILSAAAILRFHNLGESSLSNDELSALVRTDFHSFSALIDQGVSIDAHPAGVQVFEYYWIKLFGRTEAALRFPFALAGVISVLLIYAVGKRWFGKTSGLLAASALAMLQFPVLYSQIARPYSPGLMFTLCATLSWSMLLFPSDKEKDQSKQRLAAASLALSLAACAYTHYFSMLMAGIIAVSGLFFLDKRNFKIYFAACLVSAVLFLPHLPIFFRQMGYGGVGEWLGVPKSDFLGHFFDYGLNDSIWIKLLLLALCMVPLIAFTGWLKKPVFYILCIAWFLLPYGIGAWYSVKINPVLQYSTLLFSFPFLLLFLTGFIPDEKVTAPIRIVLVCFVLAAVAASTVAEKKYYSTNHFGVFKELASDLLKWNSKYGKENITAVLNVTSPKYVGYYFDKYHSTPAVSQYYVADDSSLARLRDLVDSAATPYFVYGWSNMPHYYEAVDLVREKFPFVAEQDSFFNASISLFGKNNSLPPAEKPVYLSGTSYEDNLWGEEEDRRSMENAHTGSYSENMENKEYSLTYSRKLSGLNGPSNNVVSFSAWFNTSELSTESKLVMSFEGEGKTWLWAANPARAYNRQPGRWQKIILTKQIPEGIPPTAEVKCYFWNPGKKKVFVDDLSVTVRSPEYYR